MDGIVSGPMSIIPIIPDQSIIADRFGVKAPPVEIMPLPSNSFMSEDATAEMLNNPYTLSLDAKGYSKGEAGGKVGMNGPVADAAAMTDDALTAALLNEAYTLSLGNEENAPIAIDIAREMARMKNYELLGKTATRQLYRMNPETGAAEPSVEPSQSGNASAMITEKVRSLLSQSAAAPNSAVVQTTVQSGEEQTIIPQMREVVLTSPELQPEGTANPAQSAQPSTFPAAASAQRDLPPLSNLAPVQLSASDIEAILTLEPELQETMLNMLSNLNTGVSSKLTVQKPQTVLYDARQAEVPDAINPPNKPGAVLQNIQTLSAEDLLTNAQPDSIRQALNGFTRPLNAAEIKLPSMTDAATAVALTAEELGLVAADVLADVKTQNALSPKALRGSLANLRKVNELPYSLYLFGNVTINKKGEYEEDSDIAITENTGAGKAKTEFLKISDAIKMASVLHNIYHGGSGNFPQETPWHAPYLRYAIKNGIVKDGEFIDVNDFATRAEMAYIFSGSVPKAEFPIINFISDIPAVPEAIGYNDSIYLLFRAGVLAKSEKTGGFDPESVLTKTEAASIIGRIATPSDRKRF